MPAPLRQRADLTPADAGAFPIRLPSLDGTSGAFLIGTFIGLILLGVIFQQAYRYTRAFPGDSLWLKVLVALVVCLEIASSGINMHVCYHTLVTNSVHPENIAKNTWTYSVSVYGDVTSIGLADLTLTHQLTPLTTEATLYFTQSWFARRLWHLGPRYRPVVILSCICIVAELGVIMAPTVHLLKSASPVASEEVPYVYLIPTSFALAVAVNAMLTVPLIYTLHRKRTGFSRSTTAMLDLLIRYSVSTGLLNGVFDLITAILAFTFPHDYLYTIPALPAGKLYGITLLAALHSCRTVRERGQSTRGDDVSDLVFGVSVLPRTATRPSADTGRPLSRERAPANQLGALSMVTGDEDAIELEALGSPSLQGHDVPAEYGDEDKGPQPFQRSKQRKARV